MSSLFRVTSRSCPWKDTNLSRMGSGFEGSVGTVTAGSLIGTCRRVLAVDFR